MTRDIHSTMEQDTRHHRKYIQRDHTRFEKKEEHSENRPRQTNTTTEKTKYQRRFKRTLTPHHQPKQTSFDTWRNIITFQRTKRHPNTQKRTPRQTSTRHIII